MDGFFRILLGPAAHWASDVIHQQRFEPVSPEYLRWIDPVLRILILRFRTQTLATMRTPLGPMLGGARAP